MPTAMQGVGVALGMEPFVDAELAAGLLVSTHRHWAMKLPRVSLIDIYRLTPAPQRS